MTKIATKADLKAKIKDALSIEEAARDSYKRDIDNFNDQKIIGKIYEIEQDEEKHVKLLKEVLKILEE
jgi:rubrerythrin